MSTSRRSSHSTRSTATTRSARPPTWRATSISNGSTLGKRLVSAPLASPSTGVSFVFAEPETVSTTETQTKRSTRRTRLLSSSSAVDSLRDQSLAAGVVYGSRRTSVASKNNPRTRLQDMFANETVSDDLGEGSSSNTVLPSNSTSSPAVLETNDIVVDYTTASPNSASNDVVSSSIVPFPRSDSPPELSSSSTAVQTPLSTSPGRMTWFASLGRSGGKGKAAQIFIGTPGDATPTTAPALSESATVSESMSRSSHRALAENQNIESTNRDSERINPDSLVDGGVQSNEALASAIEALGTDTDYSTNTIRTAPPPPLQVQPPTPPQNIPSTSTSTSAHPAPTSSPTQTKVPPRGRPTWFNAFAPYRPKPSSSSPSSSSTSPRPGTSPISPSPLSGNVSSASSSFPSSIDDEVPKLVRTPVVSDDEDGSGGKIVGRDVRGAGSGDGSKVESAVEAGGNAEHSDGGGGGQTADAASSGESISTSTSTSGGSTGTIRARTRLDSLNSLNPSASRFSISIPLLGRPKMRLEDAVKREQEKDGKEDGEKGKVEDVKDVPSSLTPESVPQANGSSQSQDSVSTSTPAPAKDPEVTAPSVGSKETANNLDSTTTTTAPALDPKVAGQSEGLTSTSASTDPVTDVANTTTSSTYSWWDYVPLGWGASGSTSTQEATDTNANANANAKDKGKAIDAEGDTTTKVSPDTERVSESESENAKHDTPTPALIINVSDESASPVPASTATVKATAEAVTANANANEVKLQQKPKAASLFSADTSQTSWLYPWTWYGYGTGTAAPASASGADGPGSSGAADGPAGGGVGGPGGPGGGNDDGGDDGSGKGKDGAKELTESEKIKEEALARDREREMGKDGDVADVANTEQEGVLKGSEQLPESQTQIQQLSNVLAASSSSQNERNPISDSASSLRSGWASFFSLSGRGRDLMVKNLQEGGEHLGENRVVEDGIKRDENGVEIMDLEEDEQPGSGGEREVVAVKSEQDKTKEDKLVTKQTSSTALTLMRALALQQNPRRIKEKEEEDKKGDVKNSKDVQPPSPKPSTKGEKGEKSVPPSPAATKGDFSEVPASPTKSTKDNVLKGRFGRSGSVSTTKSSNTTNVASNGKPPPPLTVSDSVKASVIASKRTGVSPAPSNKSNNPATKPSDSAAQDDSKNGNGNAKNTAHNRSKSKSKPGSGANTPAPPPPVPNLVLPTWVDTFHTAPRNYVPEAYLPAGDTGTGGLGSTLGRTMRYVSGVLLGSDSSAGAIREGSAGAGATKRRARRGSLRRRSISGGSGSGAPPGLGGELLKREKERDGILSFGHELPRSWDVIEAAVANRDVAAKKGKGKERASEDSSGMGRIKDVLRGCRKVVVIGIHGWFPGAVMRSVLGEPTGTSTKFVNMMVQALEVFQEEHGVKLDKITKIPLEGEGTINKRVEKLYASLLSNQSWMDDLHDADVIFVATHSQGSVVSTHLLDRLICDRHIRTAKNGMAEGLAGVGVNLIPQPPQRVCCLALCGIHLGPLRYLSSSSLLQPYIQYFETAAARELFDFQNTESEVSQAYVKALRNVVHHGTKMVYVASLNDQVVPIYSGLFTSVSHPLILRALYIDGDAYNSSDFLSNLLVLLLRILNCGLSDSGLLAHLSEATAGSLSGVGHSTAYEELATFSLAVNYLFLSNDGFEEHPELQLEPFNASTEMNDYEIPWALRDLIADERVAYFFSHEITQLRDAFREWHPKTTILRDIKRKLQPIQRLPSLSTPGSANSASKL